MNREKREIFTVRKFYELKINFKEINKINKVIKAQKLVLIKYHHTEKNKKNFLLKFFKVIEQYLLIYFLIKC